MNDRVIDTLQISTDWREWAVENAVKIFSGNSKTLCFTRARGGRILKIIFEETKEFQKRVPGIIWNNLKQRFKLG
jgi:hypothetical protein